MRIKYLKDATDIAAATKTAKNLGLEHCLDEYSDTAVHILMDLWTALADSIGDDEAHEAVITEYNSYVN